jgi:hypothetical protein
MTIRKISYLQGTSDARYQLPAEDHRLNHAGLWVPSGLAGAPALAVRNGVLPGPGNPGQVSVISGGLRVQPFQAVVQGTITTTQGPYEVVSDAVEDRAVTAASSTEFRRGRLVLRIFDKGAGDATDGPQLLVVYGPNAASAGAATLPALPANSLQFAEFAVSNTGVITILGTVPRTVGRGGITPVYSDDVEPGPYLGAYRDHPTLGLQRWDASNKWVTIGAPGSTTPYSVTWTASGGTPTVGNGSLAGDFVRLAGLLVFFRIFLSAGSTTNGASGPMTFSLPVAAAAFEQAVVCKLFTPGAGNFSGFSAVGTAGTIPYFDKAYNDTRKEPIQNLAAGSADINTARPQMNLIGGDYPIKNGANVLIEGTYIAAAA